MASILARRKASCDNYILITDVPLTGASREALEKKAREVGFGGRFHCIDGREICEFLTLRPEIRQSYPQLLGLADLEHILNRELYVRSEAYLQQWQPRLAVFVQNAAYTKALTTLRRHHFVVLDGPPEVGKTMIAAAIALLQATRGYEVIDVRGPAQVFAAYSKERQQVFVADDAIGSISLSPTLADEWSRDLPGILRKLDAQHSLIWTARHYILEEALAESRLGDNLERVSWQSRRFSLRLVISRRRRERRWYTNRTQSLAIFPMVLGIWSAFTFGQLSLIPISLLRGSANCVTRCSRRTSRVRGKT